MIYDNSLDKANDFITPSGDQYQILYASKVNKDGTITLTESGKADIQQEINSWKEHTDMAYILRAMAAGNYQPRAGAMYGDFTNMPGSTLEAMQLMVDAENAFYDLPLDVRQKFDGNFRNWLIMMNEDTKRFADLMGFKSETAEPAEPAEKGSES